MKLDASDRFKRLSEIQNCLRHATRWEQVRNGKLFDGEMKAIIRAAKELRGSVPPPIKKRKVEARLSDPIKVMKIIFAKRGEASRIARALGVKAQAIHQWKSVPLDQVVAVERVTGVPRHVLRSDFHNPPAWGSRFDPQQWLAEMQNKRPPAGSKRNQMIATGADV